MKRRWTLVAAVLAVAVLGALPAGRALAATCTSAGSGNWSAPGTWSGCGSGIPQDGDEVIIASGHTVTVDTNTNSINSLTVNGTLGFDTTARTVTVTGNVSVGSGGVMNTGTSGAELTHTFNLGGNLTNNGTITFDSSSRQVTTTFNGSGTQAVSGTPTSTNLGRVTVNKTPSTAEVTVSIDVSVPDTSATNAFNISSGIWNQTSGTVAVGNTNSTIASSGGVRVTGSGSWSTGASVTVQGKLVISTSGTLTIGTSSGNSLEHKTGSSFILDGGSINIAGRFSGDSTTQTTTFNMSSGTFTVATIGHTAAKASFDISASGSSFTMSGGSIVLQNPSTGSTKIDYRNLAGTTSVTGGTVQFGNSSTSGTPTFQVGANDGGTSILPNLTVNATGTPSVNLNTAITVWGNVIIGSGTTLTANAQIISLTGNWTNNGTFTPGTGTVTFNGSTTQTLGGTSSTTFNNLTINNTSADSAGVTLGVGQTVNGTLTLTDGLLKVAGYNLTLGTGASITHPGSTTSMVVTDTDGSESGDGYLCKSYSGNGSFAFPVGDAYGTTEYSPATLNFTADLGASTVCVRVTNARHPNWPGSDYPTYISRYWSTTSTDDAFTCTASFTYVDADVVLGGTSPVQTENALYHKVYSGGSWTTKNQTTAGTNTLSSSVTSFSDHTAFSGSPLAVTLAAFTARATPAGVTLAWETVSETDNAGFNIYRSAAGAGLLTELSVGRTRLNAALIPAAAPGSSEGRAYTWTDATAQPNTAYVYQLEAVALDGAAETLGTASVLYQPRWRTWLPLVASP